MIVDRKYINGSNGAPCTTLLKKRVRQEWERTLDEPPVYIWGYDVGERHRADSIIESSEFTCEFPLINEWMTKPDCHGFLAELGIKRPVMYDLGYSNNNCIGCVKGGKGYWNKVRKDFPQVFKRRAKQERLIGHSCIKDVFLDELDKNVGNMAKEIMPECSLACLMVAGDDDASN